jgi:hypothetical protein
VWQDVRNTGLPEKLMNWIDAYLNIHAEVPYVSLRVAYTDSLYLEIGTGIILIIIFSMSEILMKIIKGTAPCNV